MTAIGFLLLVLGLSMLMLSWDNKKASGTFIGTSIVIALFGVMLLTAGFSVFLWRAMP